MQWDFTTLLYTACSHNAVLKAWHSTCIFDLEPGQRQQHRTEKRSITTLWAGLLTNPHFMWLFIPGPGNCDLPTGYLSPQVQAGTQGVWQGRLGLTVLPPSLPALVIPGLGTVSGH